MKTIKVGLGRLYKNGCSLAGRKEILMPFKFGDIVVEVYIGPNSRHVVLAMEIGPPEPIDKKLRNRSSRGKGYNFPSSEVFPADVYTELVATQFIEVDDTLAIAFFDKDKVARDKLLRIAQTRQASFTSVLDLAAGILGLRWHYFLVDTPIIEQFYAYRKETSYALSSALNVIVTDAYSLDISNDGITKNRKRLPLLRPDWTLKRASEVLAWLLRSWATKDSVLKFVSLFIPLECVIPRIPNKVENWKKNQQAIIALIKKHLQGQDQKDLTMYVTELRKPSQPLVERFENWATKAALPGWKSDVTAFRRFGKMRNSLLHAGQTEIEFEVTVKPDDVRTLEDIAERYVSLALFGDANVYESKKRPSQFAN